MVLGTVVVVSSGATVVVVSSGATVVVVSGAAIVVVSSAATVVVVVSGAIVVRSWMGGSMVVVMIPLPSTASSSGPTKYTISRTKPTSARIPRK